MRSHDDGANPRACLVRTSSEAQPDAAHKGERPLLSLRTKPLNVSHLWLDMEAAGVLFRLLAWHYASKRGIEDDPKDCAHACYMSRRKFERIRAKLLADGYLASVASRLVPGPSIDFLPTPREDRNPDGWRSLREQIIDRDGERCAYCGSEDGPFDIDHVVPRSRGGSHDPSNLTVACQRCNRSKGNMTAAEWLGGRVQ